MRDLGSGVCVCARANARTCLSVEEEVQAWQGAGGLGGRVTGGWGTSVQDPGVRGGALGRGRFRHHGEWRDPQWGRGEGGRGEVVGSGQG